MTGNASTWIWRTAICSARDCAAKAKVTCNLDKGALFAVRYICLAEDKKLFGFRISASSAGYLFAVAEQYALAHMDKPLNTLKFLRSLSLLGPGSKANKGLNQWIQVFLKHWS